MTASWQPCAHLGVRPLPDAEDSTGGCGAPLMRPAAARPHPPSHLPAPVRLTFHAVEGPDVQRALAPEAPQRRPICVPGMLCEAGTSTLVSAPHPAPMHGLAASHTDHEPACIAWLQGRTCGHSDRALARPCRVLSPAPAPLNGRR